jgi:UDP-N-acetylglucosamine:LPS N-acetylglucosamine transferase
MIYDERKIILKKSVLFVCDRGGHYSEMMALKELFKEYDSRLLTTLNTNIDKDASIEHIKIYCPKNYSLISFAITFIQCFFVWISFRPKIIISTGARMAVAMFLWGKLFGSKLIYIETRARVYSKSHTGKILEKICDKIIVQWPEMQDIYNNSEYWGTLI